MRGVDLVRVFEKSERLHKFCTTVLGGLAAAIWLQACSPSPDPCGPLDTQQGGTCASLRANAGTGIGAFSGPPVCGDGIKTGHEECDGEDLGGVTCEMIGAGSGTLLCDPITCRFVFFQCASSVGVGETIADTGGVSGIGGAGGNTAVEACTPTLSWENSIEQTVQSLCGTPGCHTEANSYDGFVSWYNTYSGIRAGSFETYLSPDHYNPRSPEFEYDRLKCWILLGMP